ELERPQLRSQRPARDAALCYGGEHLRKQRHCVKADHQSAPHSTSIRFLSRSTFFTYAGTQGKSRVLSPAASVTSSGPLWSSPFTTPSTTPASFTTSSPTRSDQ